MYLWSIGPLERSLRRGEVSDRESLWYYGALSIVGLMSEEYSLWWGSRSGWLFYSEAVVLALMTIWGLVRCWEVNGGVAGDEILLKIVCLSVPIGIRASLLGLVAGQLLSTFRDRLLGSGAFRDPSLAYNYFSYAIFISMAIFPWRLLHRSLENIARPEGNHHAV